MAGRANFVHLHNHGEHSVLDGGQTHVQMAKAALAVGQTAIALTDHGNLYGAYSFQETMLDAGLKPIIGMEAYFAPSGRSVKEPVYLGTSAQRRHDFSRGAYTHISLLASGSAGLDNLYRLHSLSFSEGFYHKPRVDLGLLSDHSEGIFALSGCAGSYISCALRMGNRSAALEHAKSLRSIFGDRFYIELMSHGITDVDGDGFDEEALNTGLISLSDELGIPCVVTNDAHYATVSDAATHDALLCIQTQAKLKDEKRFRFTGSGFYLKSREEMNQLGFDPKWLDATSEIADRIEPYGNKFAKRLRMPKVPGTSLNSAVGLSVRLPAGQEYKDRIELELSVIEQGGFEDYLLVLADAIDWARRNGVFVGPGRGSVGGSLVAYALGITDIDPLSHGLLFERFLNPERVSLPDIDVDFSDKDKVLEYLSEKHGAENVAQIMTLGTIKAKAALKDANRISGGTFAQGSLLTDMLPAPLFGVSPTLEKMPPVELAEQKAVVKLAKGLEGLVRNVGVHAAGVVVSPEPLAQILPVWKRAGNGPLLTGFDAGPVEALGLVKMDFLGVRNLTVIQETIDKIGMSYQDLVDLPLDDHDTLEMLAQGNSDGVFQLDSDGMKRLLKDVKVDSFNDISAVLALYRPGPMGARSHIEYAKRKRSGSRRATINWELDDILTELLGETYGVIVYQEQVMAVLRTLAGWSLGKADLARKAMGKKDHAVLQKLYPEFCESMGSNGFSKEASDDLWAVLLPFADYAFNKSHTVGYGLVSYWTAYLKAHYPANYMASLLSSVSDDPERLPIYLAEATRLGLKILPPDINESNGSFTASKGSIRFGICAIKGVGESAFEALVKKRPYKSIDHFYRTASLTVLNIGVLNALIRSGALDSLDDRRILHSEEAEALSSRARDERQSGRQGKVSLLRKQFQLPTEASIQPGGSQLRNWETEYLGMQLSHSEMALQLIRPLTEAEWGYVGQLIDACPGSAPVNIYLGNNKITTGHFVDPDAILKRLPAIIFLEISDGLR